jgi:hypothetical protein
MTQNYKIRRILEEAVTDYFKTICHLPEETEKNQEKPNLE